MKKYPYLLLFLPLMACESHEPETKQSPQTTRDEWNLNSSADWPKNLKNHTGFAVADGKLTPESDRAQLRSQTKSFKQKVSLSSLTIGQSPEWLNWESVASIKPTNLRDAPVFLARGGNDYWIMGRYGKNKSHDSFEAKSAELDGFDVPLMTTPYPNQFDAPGGLKPGLGGYHAWQSRDMTTWVHHGPVTEKFSRWVTTAEIVDGKAYIYYDFPNDQDPHVYVDDDLSDGQPGKNHGMAFRDPTHGSDCGIIRDLDGHFHLIYEDWSPINARKHSWDSPVAGHAVSENGLTDFKILDPVVDQRTEPTGKTATFLHPHWKQEDPDNWKSNVAEYEVHEPEQNAFGDWAPISIGGQYYLFCDYHPANEKIRIGWFTSSSIDGPFEFCGEIGSGHPDPDIGFANGQFYLITQLKNDYISPGPWVGDVEVRVGVDTNGDATLDHWSDWQLVEERYERIDGFAKQIKRHPAAMDVSQLPAGHAFAYEVRVQDQSPNASKPVIAQIDLSFAPTE